MPKPPYTEAQAIAALKRLAKRWPQSLWLFSGPSLYVMRAPADGHRAIREGQGMNPDLIVDVISGIPHDGGDW